MQQEKGCVYFFKHIGLSPVKIGYSTRKSPTSRFNQFKTYAPYGAEMLGFFFNLMSLRRSRAFFMRKYKPFRLDGEWFDISEDKVFKEIAFLL